jgi:CheY-like chemotaxis protein
MLKRGGAYGRLGSKILILFPPLLRGKAVKSWYLDLSTPVLVVVLDDSRDARVITARIVESGGWPSKEAANVGEAIEILNSTAEGTRCLVIVASWLAPEHGEKLMRHPRGPKLLLSCVRPPSCPIVPEMQCADLGCIQKPLDFWHPSILISRVKALLLEPCSEEGTAEDVRNDPAQS